MPCVPEAFDVSCALLTPYRHLAFARRGSRSAGEWGTFFVFFRVVGNDLKCSARDILHCASADVTEDGAAATASVESVDVVRGSFGFARGAAATASVESVDVVRGSFGFARGARSPVASFALGTTERCGGLLVVVVDQRG